MPFLTFQEHVGPGDAMLVHTAGPFDRHVWITTEPLPGQGQSSNGYNFSVGGPEIEDVGTGGPGLYRMTSDWESDVEDGDEIWVRVSNEGSPWTEQPVPLTVMVRSSAPPRQARTPVSDGGTGGKPAIREGRLK